MFRKAKEIVVSANSRTKSILAVACIYMVVILTTVSAGAVNEIINYIPTVDISIQDGVQEETGYLVKQDTVGNVLTELSIDLNNDDKLNRSIDYIVQQNDLIKITRVDTKTVTVEEEIPFSTVTRGSGVWSSTVVQEGEKGLMKKTYLVTYANGNETSRKLIKEQIVKEPVNKIIEKGGVKAGTTFSGRLTTYGGDCNGCTGKSASGLVLSATKGVNNSGTPFLTYNGKKYYCLAADKSIPFGTVIKISNHVLGVESTIYGIVVDRGSAITGNKIDIFKGSESNGNTYFTGGTSKNAKFEIVSLGSGKAYFWR